ncbi:MAG: hypothetical protein QOE32_5376, partial [Pseudonocardiales bacterium]|nr:hypothetical protein [Pseudonocardiales bacterium]
MTEQPAPGVSEQSVSEQSVSE